TQLPSSLTPSRVRHCCTSADGSISIHPIAGGGLLRFFFLSASPHPLRRLSLRFLFRFPSSDLLPRVCAEQQMTGGLVVVVGGGGGGGGVNPTLVRVILAVMALGLAGYIVGPPLCWHLAEAFGRSSACPPCAACDCSAQPLLSLPQGAPSRLPTRFAFSLSDLMVIQCLFPELINVSFTAHYFDADCAKRDSEVSEEMDKNFTDLLAEELKLKEKESTDAQHRADVTLLEAKKLASQYQKEADKCSSGMDTCEEAREKAEAALLEQKKLSMMWEQRGRQRGWKKPHAFQR
ncbi:hypothetical protein B296_00003702, partial [Ensete ventricosum]